MKSPSLVPSLDWNKSDADAFRESAGLETPTQSMLCADCVRTGNLTPPTYIVMVDGTSTCPQHL